MSDSIQESSAAAAGEVAMVICRVCGESWSKDTPGFEEAERMIYQSLGSNCPGGQFKRFEDIEEARDLNDVRELITQEIHGVTDRVNGFQQKLEKGQQDYISEFVLAFFLYTGVPVFMLDRWNLDDKAQSLAEKYNLVK